MSMFNQSQAASAERRNMTAMKKWFSILMIAGIVSTVSCGSRSVPVAKPAKVNNGPSQVAVGQWLVTAIDGKPIPEGSSVILDYRSDGQLVVETSGRDTPILDKEALKSVLNGLEISFPNVDVKTIVIDSLNLNVNDRKIEIKRKPGTTGISQ